MNPLIWEAVPQKMFRYAGQEGLGPAVGRGTGGGGRNPGWPV